MSEATKCDRCGEFVTNDISHYSVTISRVQYRISRIIYTRDLCLACKTEIDKWIENKTQNGESE